MKNTKIYCPVNSLFEKISKQWTLSILYQIWMWKKYFSQIKNSLEWISSRTLSLRLKDLQKEWFISRDIVSEQPIRIEYTFTEKWKSFQKELYKLWNWWKKWD
jgi:DNA-binding HxlR family transcriptional regulator